MAAVAPGCGAAEVRRSIGGWAGVEAAVRNLAKIGLAGSVSFATAVASESEADWNLGGRAINWTGPSDSTEWTASEGNVGAPGGAEALDGPGADAGGGGGARRETT